MRRKDREVTDVTKIDEIFAKCRVMRLAMNEGESPYIVPLNFGYEKSTVGEYLYFHCANEGKKLDLIKACPNVCFEMDCDHSLIGGKIACDYGYTFSSIIGKGKAEILTEPCDKIHGLKVLMKHQTGRDFEIDEKMSRAVTVCRVMIENKSCKMRSSF